MGFGFGSMSRTSHKPQRIAQQSYAEDTVPHYTGLKLVVGSSETERSKLPFWDFFMKHIVVVQNTCPKKSHSVGSFFG